LLHRLVTPGLEPSPHVHQVVGGVRFTPTPAEFAVLTLGQNAFAADIPKQDVAELANCTTCGFAEDFSNYWTANLYFRARNGSYKRVPQKANRYLNGANGGITVSVRLPPISSANHRNELDVRLTPCPLLQILCRSIQWCQGHGIQAGEHLFLGGCA
jgi:hypothetical protein